MTPSGRNLDDSELDDLARLADGTLPAHRRAEVEARVAASPRLASIVKQQTVALEALRRTAEVGAPARLRAEVERARHRRRRKSGVRIIVGRALVGVAGLALALIVILAGAGTTQPSLDAAVALARATPTQAAPHARPGAPRLLRAEVDGVPFPDYAARFGWKAVGARNDAPSGRDATTVYYRRGRHEIAYTIVSGDALDRPTSARTTYHRGVEYRTLRSGGRTVLTWERGGHTCVLSGSAVRPAELITLARWRAAGTVPA